VREPRARGPGSVPALGAPLIGVNFGSWVPGRTRADQAVEPANREAANVVHQGVAEQTRTSLSARRRMCRRLWQ
jgi:hypothetical protein